MKKKIPPALLVIILIVLVAIAGVVSLLMNRYRPTKEREDLRSYYGITADEQVALVIDDVIAEQYGLYQKEEIYLSYEAVYDLLDTHFYWDAKNQEMLLTAKDGILEITAGDEAYATESGAPGLMFDEKDVPYLSLSLICKYTDIDCETYEEPHRAVIRTRWTDLQQVTVTKDTSVRVRGGIKSKVLQEVSKGETLTFLEALDNWTKVSTREGSIGYVENDCISEVEASPIRAEDTSLALPQIARDYKISMGWHMVTSRAANNTFTDVVADAEGLNVISPTWFRIEDQAGTVSSLASAAYVQEAHTRGMEVWGLIDNFGEGVSTAEVLADRTAREKIIRQLMQYASECGMDGINVDFEQMDQEAIPHFLQFLRELTLEAHAKNLIISVDNYVPQNYNMYYKRGTQGKIVDYLVIMGYDEHYSGSEEAGSVASIGFVQSGIQRTLQEVPAERVINAIPFYTRVWTETFGQTMPSSEILGMDGTERYIQEHNMSKTWDEEVGQYVAISEDDTARYTIWVEDEKSIEEKMKVISSYGLAGVAVWRLGFERSTIWDIINQYL